MIKKITKKILQDLNIDDFFFIRNHQIFTNKKIMYRMVLKMLEIFVEI